MKTNYKNTRGGPILIPVSVLMPIPLVSISVIQSYRHSPRLLYIQPSLAKFPVANNLVGLTK